jgi:hypothetical protein
MCSIMKTKLFYLSLLASLFIMVSCSTEKKLSTNLRKPQFISLHLKDGLKGANRLQSDNHSIALNESNLKETEISQIESQDQSSVESVITDKTKLMTVDAESQLEDESINYKNDEDQSHSVKKKVHNETDKKPVNGYAIASLILSILSLFLSYWGWLICFSLNILFDYLAKKQMEENPEKYRGAKLLKWSSWIFLVSAILWLVIILVML